MPYGFLADCLVILHAAYVAYVLVGEVLILLGIACGWSWIRNPWFRWTHVAAIAIVAVEAILGVPCPLTVWENDLRTLAGQHITGDSFVGRFVNDLLFHDVHDWVLTVCYIGFAVLVVLTLVLVPPRRRHTASGRTAAALVPRSDTALPPRAS